MLLLEHSHLGEPSEEEKGVKVAYILQTEIHRSYKSTFSKF